MINDFDVIHMGGRTYNPILGRFMQADPHIQAPSNLQNYNRYSYVLNNPMSYTDPSGYFFKGIGKFVKKYWRTIAAIAIAVYAPGATGWVNSIFGVTNSVAVGAIAGAASGFVATGSLRGAALGALTGAAFGYLHGVNTGLTAGGHDLGEIALHGGAGGVSSVLNGGKFGHGFVAAGFTQALGQVDGLFTDASSAAFTMADRITNGIKAAIIGGTTSAISGGKFASGAITGAFSRALNDDNLSKLQNEEKERMLGALSKEIHDDAKSRMHQLAKWRANENWDAVRAEYAIFNNVSNNQMWLKTAYLQREFQVIAYEHVGGYISSNVRELTHRSIDLAMGAVNPNKLNLLQAVYSFISGPPPLPIQHQFVVPKADTVHIDIVRRK
ncbi:hypothetical protein VT06_04930 [Arsukibacterium sp. MJ3]|uniref:RHS repeat protein n=1 Tax=Arsukibacterium sp. MJ3 TaxID=1632859 RepID=UPI00062728E2|nr:RHS repeat-associated core domain-containing protein [Arsukibacterium sp. MJ3]KKO49552.1 hypothetical protein VT06_04930 [Arsukibacterium sp. MJ3]